MRRQRQSLPPIQSFVGGKNGATRATASYQTVCQYRREVDVSLRGRVSGTSDNYRLPRRESVGGCHRARYHNVEDNVGGKVSSHVFNYPVAGRIVLLVHCEQNAIERQPLIDANDVLDHSQHLWRGLQCERLAL